MASAKQFTWAFLANDANEPSAAETQMRQPTNNKMRISTSPLISDQGSLISLHPHSI